jgi:COMPASS component SWD2
MRVTDAAWQRFKPDESKTSVTSLDFDDSGELAIVSRTDDTLQIYNCREGKHAKELKSQKYGAHLARFTHMSSSILYASTKVDGPYSPNASGCKFSTRTHAHVFLDGIRYLSSHDNSYIRYYRGHTDTVTCLTMSPSTDEFLSCSLDNTVRMWALNSPNAKGQLNLHAPYFAAYDPSATVIAVASPPTHSILLYDLRNYDKPPFSTFDLQDMEQRFNAHGSGRNWSKIEFSNDGKSLVVATTGAGHFVLDAFEGHLKHFCQRKGTRSERRPPGDTNPQRHVGQGDVCFSPDGQFLIGGSGGNDGLVVWDVNSNPTSNMVLQPFTDLPVPSQANGRVEVVGYNQRSNLICTADKDLMLWLPDPELAP